MPDETNPLTCVPEYGQMACMQHVFIEALSLTWESGVCWTGADAGTCNAMGCATAPRHTWRQVFACGHLDR